MTDKSPQLFALFCDSVRHEVGGTQSFIGVLQEQLIVPSFPATVSRLSVFIWLHVHENIFDTMAFEIFREDTGEVLMSLENSEDSGFQERMREIGDRFEAGIKITSAMEGHNIVVHEPMTLGVKGRFGEGKDITARTKLRIVQRSQEHS